MTEPGEYTPDLVFPPGDTLKELLDERGMSQAELARRMRRPEKTISEIIGGKARLTNDTALELERVTGVAAVVWSNLQNAYERFSARQAQVKQLESQAEWLKELPLREMTRRGWVTKRATKGEQVQELLRFFAVASVDAWKEQYQRSLVALRASAKGKPGARAAWFRRVEQCVEKAVLDVPEYDSKAFKRALDDARAFTRRPIQDALNMVEERCRSAGVVVTAVQELSGAGISGATFWHKKRPAIALTLRFKTDDQFWFSFFHEAGHVLLHGKEIFLEMNGTDSEAEKQADRFAAEHLLPSEDLARLLSERKPISKARVEVFAESIGIAPGIVVGRLQHDGHLPRTHLNGLKSKLQWRETT